MIEYNKKVNRLMTFVLLLCFISAACDGNALSSDGDDFKIKKTKTGWSTNTSGFFISFNEQMTYVGKNRIFFVQQIRKPCKRNFLKFVYRIRSVNIKDGSVAYTTDFKVEGEPLQLKDIWAFGDELVIMGYYEKKPRAQQWICYLLDKKGEIKIDINKNKKLRSKPFSLIWTSHLSPKHGGVLYDIRQNKSPVITTLNIEDQKITTLEFQKREGNVQVAPNGDVYFLSYIQAEPKDKRFCYIEKYTAPELEISWKKKIPLKAKGKIDYLFFENEKAYFSDNPSTEIIVKEGKYDEEGTEYTIHKWRGYINLKSGKIGILKKEENVPDYYSREVIIENIRYKISRKEETITVTKLD